MYIGLRSAPVCGAGTIVEPGCNCKTVKGEVLFNLIFFKILIMFCPGKDCIFPFTFRGQTYSRCTKAESENGRAW